MEVAMSTVALLSCPEYDVTVLKGKIYAGLDLIGFDPARFQDKTVLLKPNLLTGAIPQKAVTTHPAFFQAVVQIVKENGGVPLLAENPATKPLQKVIDAAGYREIVNTENIDVADMRETRVLVVETPLKFKRFEISSPFFGADMIVNLPKLKTHSLTRLTGAVKNFLGVIPGLNKSQWHVKAPSAEEFSELLLDLNECLYSGFVPPKSFLHIMDAVMGMEGEGPGPSGKPRFAGAILVSEDPLALDMAAANLIGMDYREVHTITGGFKRSFGMSSPEELVIAEENSGAVRPVDFVFPRKKNLWSWLLRGPFISRRFKNAFIEKPVPRENRCTLCYQCKSICPAKAIEVQTSGRNIPVYDYDKCIRCFCCMEICPEAAIHLKKGRLQWLLGL
jgi:uncharacterized protein (DUF362 family)/Pyruvate/2-oxoacid:ferredoxin oxidoreductase delta subunit